MALSTMTNRSAGDSITASDWDIARNNILLITGSATGSQEGWGQSFSVYNPSAGATISDTNTNDIINAAQDIATYVGASVTVSDVANAGSIQETDLNTIQSTITNAYNNRFSASSSYLSTEAKIDSTRTSSWNTSVTHNFTVDFTSDSHAKEFFNAGGKITFSASRSGGATNDQNTDWTNLLSAMGTIKMGYTSVTASSGSNTGSRGFYDLTSSMQEIYIKTGSGSYSSNYYQISASYASASGTISFQVVMSDVHTGRGYFDTVDGTLTHNVGQDRPNSGTLPNGYAVTVATPTYAESSEL
jgi:hypothetical protein